MENKTQIFDFQKFIINQIYTLQGTQGTSVMGTCKTEIMAAYCMNKNVEIVLSPRRKKGKKKSRVPSSMSKTALTLNKELIFLGLI